MSDFNPDWLSPPSDTIKDILEERGENYHLFVREVADATGWSQSIHTIYEIFDGIEEMYFGVADYLSQKLGSTPEFWMARSQQYILKEDPNLFSRQSKVTGDRAIPKWKPTVYIDEDRLLQVQALDDIKLVLENVISHCLSAQIKRDDAPSSSETHLNTAIAALHELLPNYEPLGEEYKAALQWAIDEGKILRGEK